jgi:hypothetical protein
VCNSSWNKWRLTGNFENELPESDSGTGFADSYKTLNNLLPKVGIDYIHIPQLGIESNKRQDLEIFAYIA